jgi:hypothetical protein
MTWWNFWLIIKPSKKQSAELRHQAELEKQAFPSRELGVRHKAIF